MVDGMGRRLRFLCYDLVRTFYPFRYLPLPCIGWGRAGYLGELSQRSRWGRPELRKTLLSHASASPFSSLNIRLNTRSFRVEGNSYVHLNYSFAVTTKIDRLCCESDRIRSIEPPYSLFVVCAFGWGRDVPSHIHIHSLRYLL